MSRMMEPRIMRPSTQVVPNPYKEYSGNELAQDDSQRRIEFRRDNVENDDGLGQKSVTEPANDCGDGKPKILSKVKFFDVYSLVAGLRYVVVQPFNPNLFMIPSFQTAIKRAQEYAIHSAQNGSNSVCMLRFATIEEGEFYMISLKECLASQGANVSHLEFDKNKKFSNGNHFILDGKSTGLKTWMSNLYWKENNEDAFCDRTVIIENAPQCQSEELPTLFPKALNIVNYTLDPNIGDSIILEYGSAAEAAEAIKLINGSTFKGKHLCANALFQRLYKLMNHANKYNKKKQDVITLSDQERLQKIKEFIAVQNEKDAMLNRTDIIGHEKEYRFHKLEAQWYPIQKALFSDAKRRFDEENPLCERPDDIPEHMQRNIFGKGVLDKRDEHRKQAKKKIEDRRKKIEADIDAINRKKRNGKALQPPKNNKDNVSATGYKRVGAIPRDEEPPQKKGFGAENLNKVPSLMDKGFWAENSQKVPSLIDKGFRAEYSKKTPSLMDKGFGAENSQKAPSLMEKGFGAEYSKKTPSLMDIEFPNPQSLGRSVEDDQPHPRHSAPQSDSCDFDQQPTSVNYYDYKQPEIEDFGQAHNSNRAGYAPEIESFRTSRNDRQVSGIQNLATNPPENDHMMVPRSTHRY